MALRCVSPYKGTYKFLAVVLAPGDLVDDAEMEAFLLADSPGSFEEPPEIEVDDDQGDLEAEQDNKAIEEAPADKMIKSSPGRKGARRGEQA